MPKPLEGLVAVAEYGSPFDADAAAAALQHAGIDATTSADPALRSVVQHWATDRTVEVLVRREDVEAAIALLDGLATTDLPPEFREEWEPTTWAGARSRAQARGCIVAVLVVLLVAVVVTLLLLAV